jgi:hypothetical protein
VKFVPLIVTLVPTGPLEGEKEVIVGAGALVTVKLVELVAVPPAVVTVSGPVVAPLGNVAVICVLELTVNDAEAPLNPTAVAPLKFVPLMVTLVPAAPLVGENELIVGAGGGAPVTVKLVGLVAVPPGVVTVIGPLVAPLGTFAVICVLDTIVKVVSETPLNRTAVAPVKFVPVIVTLESAAPLVGENELIVGAAQNRKVCQAGLNEAPAISPAHHRFCPSGPHAPMPGSLGSRA